MNDLRIVTDAVADLPPELVARWSITVAPVHITLDGTTHTVTETASHDWLYNALTMQDEIRPQTSAPAVADFVALFRRLADEGAKQIVGLFTASTVSSTADHARLAARELHGVEVHIIETAQVSLGEGLLVLEAAQAAAAGASPQEIAAQIARLRQQTLILGVLPSLTYLRRGGRVNGVLGLLGDLFRIKPIIFFYEGKAGLWSKVRTYRRAMEMLAPMVHPHRLRRLAVLHTRAPQQQVAEFHRRIVERFGDPAVPLLEAGPVFAAHIGPGALGLVFIGNERLTERYPKLAAATAASDDPQGAL